MHIGNARTALFNWLFARHHGGKFLMRIEDTDRERYSKEAVEVIIEGLKWLELDWDNKELYSQYENRFRHIEVAEQLVKEGKAYYCYCSAEELEEMRRKAKEEGWTSFYDRRWRDRDASEAPEGVKPVVRIKAPLEGATVIDDKVQGEVKVDNRNLDDFVLLRSDGSPTYMLAVVVDDHDMGVTHVIRGDDHMNNTFRQRLIYDAMGWDLPVFAHVPLIHGPDGAKFSKRHGAQSVAEYREMGFLPEAMRNYLLRLGWAHGDDEIISTEQAIEWFDLDGLGKSASRFDFAKLESLNAHYIKECESERLLSLILSEYKNRDIEITDQARSWLEQGLDDLRERGKTIPQVADAGSFYVSGVPESYDEKAANTLNSDGKDLLGSLKEKLEALESFDHESIEQACRELAEETGSKLGKAIMPLRAAITGTSVSPPIFKAAEIMGREEVLKRVDAALTFSKS
jgi:glutamyl-tRNA synthetase